MSNWQVNVVSAFGRGETLAMALQESGFKVRVLDFTDAFSSEYKRGVGPFPVLMQSHLPEQKQLLGEVRPLPRGVVFWLPQGPLELSGEMAAFYQETRNDVQTLKSNSSASDFESDWLRRFMLQLASAFHMEPWNVHGVSAFPFDQRIGLIPSFKERRALSFERFQALGYEYVSCKKINELRNESSRLTELSVDSVVLSGQQWIWCLSSRESEIVAGDVAKKIFTKGIWRPDWSWVSFQGTCERGPWSQGFPEHSIVIGDIHLPWCYANTAILRWLDSDVYQVWVKVPAKAIGQAENRTAWASELENMFNQRLRLARWKIDAKQWGICPHSPVFDLSHREWGVPVWKNWDWIAPETLPRLDLGERLERESVSYHRLIQWRTDQQKKQGVNRDSAVHAP